MGDGTLSQKVDDRDFYTHKITLTEAYLLKRKNW